MRNLEMGPEYPIVQKESTPDSKPIEKQNPYRVLTLEEVQEVKKWIKGAVEDWHDRLNPEVVFLAECSATPVGYLIKEAWKQMYPDQNIPKFYRIDPKSSIKGTTGYDRENLHDNKEELEKKAEKLARLKKFIERRLPNGKETKVMIYDLQICYGDTEDAIDYIFTKIVGLSKDHYLLETGRNIKPGFGFPFGDGFGAQFDADDPKEFAKGGYRHDLFLSPTMKKTTKSYTDEYGTRVVEFTHPNLIYDFRGRIVKNPEARKKAINFVHDLKLAGKEAGKEFRAELERKFEIEK